MLRNSARRATSCLYGLVAVGTVTVLMLAASLAAAQVPTPQKWNPAVARTLLVYIEQIRKHGLDPQYYEPAELEQAIESGDSRRLELQATESFARVATDLIRGHVEPGKRGHFYMASDPVRPAAIAELIDRSIASGTVAAMLEDLAPRHRQYTALREQLATLSPQQLDERRKIEATLERWRWMPHRQEAQYLLVNLPEYQLHVISDDTEIASHRVIVGKAKTPTPQFATEATGVVFNPSWHVPQSIIAESVGSLVRNRPEVARAQGYTWSYSGGGLRVTQQPGPGNALGQMKLDMPNPFTVYLHDTSNRELFKKEARALSHGCVRTDRPFDLAQRLLDGSGWTRPMIENVVASGKTTRVALKQPMPVFTAYLTAYAGPDGRVGYFADPYSLDGPLQAQLNQ